MTDDKIKKLLNQPPEPYTMNCGSDDDDVNLDDIASEVAKDYQNCYNDIDEILSFINDGNLDDLEDYTEEQREEIAKKVSEIIGTYIG